MTFKISNKLKLGKLQNVKTWKMSISKFHFSVKLYEIRKKIMIQNYLLHKDLQKSFAQKQFKNFFSFWDI